MKNQLNLFYKIKGYNEKGWEKSSRPSGDGASPHRRRLLFAGLAKYTPKYKRIRVYLDVFEMVLNFFTKCSRQGCAKYNVGVLLRSN